jgi:fibronectin type 3 domain-containing protein
VDHTDNVGVTVYRSTDRRSGYDRRFSYPPIEGSADSVDIWVDTDIDEGRRYYYFMRSIDGSGNQSISSDTVTLFVEDHTPPAPPSGVTATSRDDGISITWDPNSEPDLNGYEIERASDSDHERFGLLNDSLLPGASWFDRVDTLSETTYGYVVYAVDRSFNRSEPSRMVYARMPDKVAPQTPIIRSTRVEGGEVVIEWTPAPEEDLMRYVIYRSDSVGDFARVGISSTSTYADDPVSAGLYRYAVASVDSAGNESTLSGPVHIRVAWDTDVRPPSALRVERVDDYLLVSWEPVEDAAGYVLQRRDSETDESVLLAELGRDDTSFRDWHADPSSAYVYILQARNEDWVLSVETEVRYRP